MTIEATPRADFGSLVKGMPVTRRRLRAGEVLFHQGDPGEAAQLVLDGLVGLEVSGGHREPLIAALIRKSEVAAPERLLYPGSRHETTARALTNCEVQLIRASDLEAAGLTAKVSGLATALVVQRSAELYLRLVEAAHHSASHRVAGALCRLAGDDDTVSVTQDVVAAVAGVVRVTANAELRRFADAGLVLLERKMVTLLDRAALERLSR